MSQENKNNDNEQKFNLSDKLAEDIKRIYKTSATVPAEIDRAILGKASQKLTQPHSRFHILRWAGPTAAAAAIIIIACISMNQNQKSYRAPMSALVKNYSDIDNSGRVDILDAFKLAKYIQSENTIDKKWDMNGDGLVDGDDVEKIALVAVSLDKGALK
ncbi:MAG: hypothetical protein JW787_02595 [Sedimentisphaerales bacterium]|nr:hypothetical protein [Sedimentisphaerales bacterium]